MESGVYQFFIENANDTKNTLSDQVYHTIVAIIEEFFSRNDSAILYICDVRDDKQSARDRGSTLMKGGLTILYRVFHSELKKQIIMLPY